MNTEWKPIASAPKDGTRVLLWNENFTAPCSGQFYGFDDWKMDSDIPPFAFQPTHWMPLPPAPTSHPIPTGATGEDTDSFEDPSALAAVADALAEDTSNDNAQFAAAYLYRQAKAIIDTPAAGDALDKARLDWLEQHDGRFYNKDRISSIVGVGFLIAGDLTGMRHQSVRAAIDAAIAQQSQHSKGDEA